MGVGEFEPYKGDQTMPLGYKALGYLFGYKSYISFISGFVGAILLFCLNATI